MIRAMQTVETDLNYQTKVAMTVIWSMETDAVTCAKLKQTTNANKATTPSQSVSSLRISSLL